MDQVPRRNTIPEDGSGAKEEYDPRGWIRCQGGIRSQRMDQVPRRNKIPEDGLGTKEE
jgi:hypothetical protein